MSTSNSKKNEPKDEKEAEKLLVLIDESVVSYFHTPSGKAFVSVVVGDDDGYCHVETHPVGSRGFEDWLGFQYYQRHRTTVHLGAINEAIAVVKAKAKYEGEEEPLWIRVGECDGSLYIDLCDSKRRVVEITPDGWSVVDSPPLHFIRPKSMLALPDPVKGGSIVELRKFVNLQRQEDWILFLAWLVQALRPSRSYPILTLHGGEDSAKTTMTRVAARSVDPRTPQTRALPSSERDLMIAANHCHVLAFDNISYMPGPLSDALCRLATGGGLGTRQNYTDDEEQIFEAVRPIVMNGIGDFAIKGDLLDRQIPLHLAEIPDSKRQAEGEYWAAFEEAQPRIFGALLDAMSAALRKAPSVRLHRMPRLADFALWATAAEEALGLQAGAFMSAYESNRAEASDIALEASVIVEPIARFMNGRKVWTGTCAELLAELNRDMDPSTRKQRNWPQNPRALSSALARCERNLHKRLGIKHSRLPREAGSRLHRLECER